MVESVRRVQGWRRNMEAPIFTDGTDGDMCAALVARRRVLLTGQPITAGRLQVPAGVSVYTEGHYPRIMADGGEVSWAAQWFGESDYSPSQAERVWQTVERAIQHEWHDEAARLFGTPATTGRDLWARSIREGEAWPVLSPETQQVIRATAGQGRMETFRPLWHGAELAPEAAQLPALYEYDARMAYVALLRNLPVGEPTRITRQHEIKTWQAEHPYSEGRYQVTWKAPDGWRHPGLLPAHGAGERDWEWPRRGDVPSWAGGAEIWVALKFGWQIRFHDAYVWTCAGDPLRGWSSRLLRMLARIDTELDSDQLRKMGRSAVRAILLHTIGAFHGSRRKVSESGPLVPDDALGVRVIRKGWTAESRERILSWYRLVEPAWPEMIHPEWSATIWGRARARLAYSHRGGAGFMTLLPEQIVALRTDAIYTTELTRWDTDNGDPGHYTLRGVYVGPHAWPVNGGDVLAIAGRR